MAAQPINSGDVLRHARAAAEAGNTAEAERLCRTLLEGEPRHVGALHLLALVLGNTGRAAEGAEHLARARAIAPESPLLAGDLAVMALKAANRETPARVRAGLAVERVDARACMRVARLAEDRKQQGLAEEAWRTAIGRGGEPADCWTGLGRTLERQDRLDEAREAFGWAVAAGAGDAVRFRAATMLPVVYDDVAHVDRTRDEFARGVEALAARGLSIADPAAEIQRVAFTLAYQGHNDRDLMVALADLFRRASPALAHDAPHVAEGPSAGRRLRVGFVSRFLYEQTVGSLMEGIIAGLDRGRFEVHVIAPPKPEDPTWQRIAASADRVHPLPGRLALAQRTLSDARLDALVFAGVGMDAFLYFLSFGRYARLQAVTWGHPVTTGVPTLDYYLSAEDAEVPEAQEHYSEQLVRLARPSIRYGRPERRFAERGRQGFGLPQGGPLYGCLQTLYKFHPAFDVVLRQVLERDPIGRLVLLTQPDEPLYERLAERLKRSLGPLARRAVRVPYMPRASFQALVGEMDVMLDPLHFGGGQTTLEAIAAGTPVVTLPSRFRRGRLSLAYLRRAGVTDTVATDVDDYVAKAVALGSDPIRRAALARRLMAGGDNLFDDDTPVRELEDFLLRA